MTKSNKVKPSQYLIHIKETINPQTSSWFEEAEIEIDEQGESIIKCYVVDQSALHGILAIIRDLNLTLMSVCQIEQSNSTGQGNLDVSPEE
jgi:hypothetical protein